MMTMKTLEMLIYLTIPVWCQLVSFLVNPHIVKRYVVAVM